MKFSPGLRAGIIVCGLFTAAISSHAQDGAGYDPAAAKYRAPGLSMAGGADSPELDAAIGSIWNGHSQQALSALQDLAGRGDTKAALFLGAIYRQQTKLAVKPDPERALYFYKLASGEGSGEASERIAEMLEHHEISAPGNMDAAGWRRLAVHQGWIEEKLSVVCFDWIHGPERLHCVPLGGGLTADPFLTNGCLSPAALDQLSAQGVAGTLRHRGDNSLLRDGPAATAILIMDREVASEQDLKEPYGTSVIYIQTAVSGWRMLPQTAPLLARYIVLKPGAAGHTLMLAQTPEGAGFGGACGPTGSN